MLNFVLSQLVWAWIGFFCDPITDFKLHVSIFNTGRGKEK